MYFITHYNRFGKRYTSVKTEKPTLRTTNTVHFSYGATGINNTPPLTEEDFNYTTFRIGGKADILVKPKTYEQIAEVINLCKKHEVPYYILGNGSNLLVSDDGIRGIVLKIDLHES